LSSSQETDTIFGAGGRLKPEARVVVDVWALSQGNRDFVGGPLMDRSGNQEKWEKISFLLVGVVDHGLFCDMSNTVIVAGSEGVR
jgi:hypothetical protein